MEVPTPTRLNRDYKRVYLNNSLFDGSKAAKKCEAAKAAKGDGKAKKKAAAKCTAKAVV